ncbi:hypothetical protein QR680_017001 [Steinernema hermaphroditum]|uniref:Uncharacterized protein n=1 Tax=Steinernema hermaphroditum TaxID=289476 RepID=A0AA39HCY5_9BILA|nr:hypothetical protein QR680_017001 [Steinernema hermaphroditum]
MEAERSKRTVNVRVNWTQLLPQLTPQLLGALKKLELAKCPDLIVRVGCCPEGVHIRLQADARSSVSQEMSKEELKKKAEVMKPGATSTGEKENASAEDTDDFHPVNPFDEPDEVEKKKVTEGCPINDEKKSKKRDEGKEFVQDDAGKKENEQKEKREKNDEDEKKKKEKLEDDTPAEQVKKQDEENKKEKTSAEEKETESLTSVPPSTTQSTPTKITPMVPILKTAKVTVQNETMPSSSARSVRPTVNAQTTSSYLMTTDSQVLPPPTTVQSPHRDVDSALRLPPTEHQLVMKQSDRRAQNLYLS